MGCEEEFNALRRAERELSAWREQHPGLAGGSVPVSPADRQHLAELTAALRERQYAYTRCQGENERRNAFEALMRDETGAPLGGGAGPPM